MALGIATALAIAGDCCKRPQRMGIMNLTWPITGLYFPLVGWWLYQSMGRASPPRAGGKTGHQAQQHAAKPK
ncbi:MAG TPA: hypothetical protein VK110_06800 [Salinisphaeraceae bacterium]|nr:hypothetical protein [Salinisphaeraceae bacterium]